MTTLKILFFGALLSIGIQFIQAWNAPTQAPPGGNVPGPITTGGAQFKTGPLAVNTNTVPLPGFGLAVSGDTAIGGKAYSESTVAADPGTTMVTKDYVDAAIANALSGGGGGGASNVSCHWSGWLCSQSNSGVNNWGSCMGYVSGGHVGNYTAVNVYCDPNTQTVTNISYNIRHMY